MAGDRKNKKATERKKEVIAPGFFKICVKTLFIIELILELKENRLERSVKTNVKTSPNVSDLKRVTEYIAL